MRFRKNNKTLALENMNLTFFESFNGREANLKKCKNFFIFINFILMKIDFISKKIIFFHYKKWIESLSLTYLKDRI
jgi:hypothetical protein